MRRRRTRTVAASILTLLSVLVLALPPSAAHSEQPLEGFVEVNGVRLQYLDWGGTGSALILVHGLADNPYVFADLAPALTDHHHVIAYARRGSGGSDVRSPYDVGTLTEDLRALMDALHIRSAVLVGNSAGGDEATAMAARYAARVERVVYLEGAYDWGDPDFQAARRAYPLKFTSPPAHAQASLDGYRAYQHAAFYPSLPNMRPLEAHTRQQVIIQSDGSVRPRTPTEVVDALYLAESHNEPRDYADVRCPVLAIYAEHLYDLNVSDPDAQRPLIQYEKDYWFPFQAKSIARLRREIPTAEIHRLPGAHSTLIFISKPEVLRLISAFLSEVPPPRARDGEQR